MDAEIRRLPTQPTAAVRLHEPLATLDLSEFFGKYLGKVAEGVMGRGGQLAGAPYSRYHTWGPEMVDVEIGFPVAAPLADLPALADVEPGEVGSSELPGGETAVAVHRGAYSGLGDTYGALDEWIKSQGHHPASGPWESYMDDPMETREADLRTEVSWPVT